MLKFTFPDLWSSICFETPPGSHVGVTEAMLFIVYSYWLYIGLHFACLVYLARYAQVNVRSVPWGEKLGDIRHTTHIHQTWKVVMTTTLEHDDVIKWKLFRVTGPLFGEFTGLINWPSKQSWDWWLEAQSCPLYDHSFEVLYVCCQHH